MEVEQAKAELARVISAPVGLLEYKNPLPPIDMKTVVPRDRDQVFQLQRMVSVWICATTLETLKITKKDMDKQLAPPDTKLEDMEPGDIFYHCMRCLGQATTHDAMALLAVSPWYGGIVLAKAFAVLGGVYARFETQSTAAPI